MRVSYILLHLRNLNLSISIGFGSSNLCILLLRQSLLKELKIQYSEILAASATFLAKWGKTERLAWELLNFNFVSHHDLGVRICPFIVNLPLYYKYIF